MKLRCCHRRAAGCDVRRFECAKRAGLTVRSTSETGRAGRTPTIRPARFRIARRARNMPAASTSWSRSTDKAGWSLGFAHEKWSLKTGQAFPLTLTFDGQAPFNVHGVPIADKLVRVPMPNNSSLITQFRKRKGDDGLYAGAAFPVQSRSDRAIAAVAGELRRQDEAIGVAERRRFFRAAPKPAAAAAPAPPGPRRASPTRPFNQTGTGFLVSTNGHVVTNAARRRRMRRRYLRAI